MESCISQNPTFEEVSHNGKGLPNGMAYVYHVTHPNRLESIFRQGLLPQAAAYREPADTFVDQFAPDGFSRRNAVYAYPDIPSARDRRGFLYDPEEVIIQVMVNPQKVLVAKFSDFSVVATALKGGDITSARDYAILYWRTRTLEEHLQIPGMYRYPGDAEVVIPGGVRPEFLQVIS